MHVCIEYSNLHNDRILYRVPTVDTSNEVECTFKRFFNTLGQIDYSDLWPQKNYDQPEFTKRFIGVAEKQRLEKGRVK